MRKLSLLILIAAVVFGGGCSGSPGDRGKAESGVNGAILVLAAADLAKAFREIGERFEEETGVKVTFSFGSTGQLAQQVEQGGRADVFAAANIKYVDDLKTKGLIVSETQTLYAVGRLTIWSRKGASAHPRRLQDLAKAAIRRVAIANPAHAPYGVAAKEALEEVGVWPQVSKKLVLGENASQALQFVQSGNVDAGIVPLSLAKGSGGVWELIPAHLHKPLKQSMAVLKSSGNDGAARAFVRFVNGPDGRPIMKKYGFVLPRESEE